MLEIILTPIAIYAVLAVSVVFFFILFLLSSMEARRNVRRHAVTVEEMQREMETLRAEIRSVVTKTEEVAERERAEAQAPATGAPGMSINLTRRAQVLRMHRNGADAADIARNLGVPQGEVSLTLKMHKLLLDQTLA